MRSYINSHCCGQRSLQRIVTVVGFCEHKTPQQVLGTITGRNRSIKETENIITQSHITQVITLCSVFQEAQKPVISLLSVVSDMDDNSH